MNKLDTLTDVAGRTTTTYAHGADYYLGRPVASVHETSDGGFYVILGWQERNGWNGSVEFVVSPRPSRTYRTERGALRAVARYFAERVASRATFARLAARDARAS